jgi:hypothetical protein
MEFSVFRTEFLSAAWKRNIVVTFLEVFYIESGNAGLACLAPHQLDPSSLYAAAIATPD